MIPDNTCVTSQPLCNIPYAKCFINSRGEFYDCCQIYPRATSSTSSLQHWWNGEQLESLRSDLSYHIPKRCELCVAQERNGVSSLRATSLKDIKIKKIQSPQLFGVDFGNKCNLSCWMCNETSSSTILTQKKQLGLLPRDFHNVGDRFEQRWQQLRPQILESYDHHDIVYFTFAGGEPFFNPTLVDFLNELIVRGLSTRTHVEFHTNGTKLSYRFDPIINKSLWHNINLYFSLDAVGPKLEWLRPNSKWKVITENIDRVRQRVNYVEIHCVLSVLNLSDLVILKQWCLDHNLKLAVTPLVDPWYLNIRFADAALRKLVDDDLLSQFGWLDFYNMIGSESRPGASKAVLDMFESYKQVRPHLSLYDLDLYTLLCETVDH